MFGVLIGWMLRICGCFGLGCFVFVIVALAIVAAVRLRVVLRYVVDY